MTTRGMNLERALRSVTGRSACPVCDVCGEAIDPVEVTTIYRETTDGLTGSRDVVVTYRHRLCPTQTEELVTTMAQKESQKVDRPQPNPPTSPATPTPTKPSTAHGAKESTIPKNVNP